MFTSDIKMNKKSIFCDFDHGMGIGTKIAG